MYRTLPLLALLALACESPLEPLACAPPAAIYAIRDYPMEYGLCFEGDALAYAAQSSDPTIVTAEVAGDVLIVTGHDTGEASVLVTATAADGGTGTVAYRVVARNAWDGAVERCALTPAGSEGTDFEVDYWIRANVDLVNVVQRLTVGGIEAGVGTAEHMHEGQLHQFFTSGWMHTVPTSNECVLDVDYEITG